MLDGLTLKSAPENFSLAAISVIKKALDGKFGKGTWISWEPETISIELGLAFDELLIDKLEVLRILENKPQYFYEDPIFTLYATEVINNNIADFESIPRITSLELAFALSEVSKVLSVNSQLPAYGQPIIQLTTHILVEDGYSEPVAPFDFVPQALLMPGQTKEDTESKKKAISKYLDHMSNL